MLVEPGVLSVVKRLETGATHVKEDRKNEHAKKKAARTHTTEERNQE